MGGSIQRDLNELEECKSEEEECIEHLEIDALDRKKRRRSEEEEEHKISHPPKICYNQKC